MKDVCVLPKNNQDKYVSSERDTNNCKKIDKFNGDLEISLFNHTKN